MKHAKKTFLALKRSAKMFGLELGRTTVFLPHANVWGGGGHFELRVYELVTFLLHKYLSYPK